MAVDVLSLSEQQIREMAEEHCAKNKCELVDMRKLKHTSDYYLRFVIAHCESGQEYITWLFNVECGGFHLGHYFSYRFSEQEKAYEVAFEDYLKRA